MTDRIAAVVPALDEAAAIGPVVRGLHEAGACCVLVIDGGSRDGTADSATYAGARVVVARERGYGRACLVGADRTDDDHPHEAVGFLDGDGSCDPRELPRLRTALDRADVVLGRRDRSLTEPGALPWHARLGNALVARLLWARTGRRISDLPPFKLVRRKALDGLSLDAVGYGWTVQLIARSLGQPQLRVAEVATAFRVRRGGRSKVSGSFVASLAAARAMVLTALAESAAPPVLGLMAKAPHGAAVKTRLANRIGGQATAEFWTACLADTAALCETTGTWHRVVVVPSEADVPSVRRVVGLNWTPVVQRRPGLAGALIDLFLAAYDSGADRAVAVSADNPDLPPRLVRDAVRALREQDAVLGPTRDGGYYLLALRWRRLPLGRRRLRRRLEAALPDGQLGGPSALAATGRNLAKHGWKPVEIGGWHDIDTVDDLRNLAAELLGTGSRQRAPRTSAWLLTNRDLLQTAAEASGSLTRPIPATAITATQRSTP